ncbi:MAG: hypothetical protein ACM369_08655 [Acidobacteriota bacterium]
MHKGSAFLRLPLTRGGAWDVARWVGLAAAFVVSIDLVRWWRPAVLFEPDRTWWRLWFLIWAGSIAAVAFTGFASARLFRAFSESRLAKAPLQPFPLGRSGLLAAAALAAGIALRMASLADPPPQFPDEASLIAPALDLKGSIADFRHPLRAAPYGVPKPFGFVGVLYLEAFKWSLSAWGPTPLGIRFLSAAAGCISLVTGVLLARAVLPPGGASLAALALAGLRWHLIMSQWGWVAVAVIPFIDVATLLVLRGRTRRSLPAMLAAGAVLGLGAHVYLTAWVAAAALVLYRLWPLGDDEPLTKRGLSASVFGAGFAVAVLPLFALGGPADPPYFSRAESHNLLRELRIHRSPMPFLAATADGLTAPWFVPEPKGWADLPSRSRLGWILGIAVALAFARSLVRPRDALSALLLSHAAAGLAAAVAQGESGHPNGYRFVYLTSFCSIAVAGGALALIAATPPNRRRAAALASVLLLVFAGARGAVDACVLWPAARTSFDAFRGQQTLIAEAALRWQRYGAVSVETSRDAIVVRSIVEQPRFLSPAPDPAGAATGRSFRVAAAGDAGRPGERCVEHVQDRWGRVWATVWGRRSR